MKRYLRIQVDHSRCVGSALCLATAPGYFELDDQHLSRPTTSVVPVSENVGAAAELCPMEAITLTELEDERDSGEHEDTRGTRRPPTPAAVPPRQAFTGPTYRR